jgi:hypothetical protein
MEVLPWYDVARERAHDKRFRAQIAESKRVNAEAARAIAASRITRREHMRGSYQRAEDRLGRR